MLFVEDGCIKLNGVVLPGVIKSMEVKSSARIDEQDVEGSAAKPKQATGYEDAKITVELILDDTETQTKYQRFAVLRSVFRAPGQGVPQPIPIVCEDAAAHGIEKVLFKSLSHKAENKKSQLPVTLELWEAVPQTIKVTKSSGTAKTATAAGSAKGKTAGRGAYTKSASASSGLSSEYKNYLDKSRGKSPAVDNANTSKAANRVTQLPF